MRKALIAGVAILLLGIAAWLGYRAWWSAPPEDEVVKASGTTALDAVQGITGVETVDVEQDIELMRGSTPMAQRVAVLGLLNKRNGVARELTMKPGQAMRVGDVVVRLRACERTAPWEQDQYTGAFVQVDVEQIDHKWRRVFSGWLFKERPGLNVVLHPVYDVWTKSCAMTFPTGGSGTVPAGDATPRSKAKKSPVDAPAAEAPSPSTPTTESPSAADNRPT